MKKIFALAFTVLLLFSMIACDSTSNALNHKNSIITEESDSNKDANEEISNLDMSNDLNGHEQFCSTHNYVDNICSICNCSLWSGESDTSWYSVIELDFVISTAEQFAGLIDIVNGGSDLAGVKISLANHIDMNNRSITPIGATPRTVFSGWFDGNGYTVSNVLLTEKSLKKEKNQIREYDVSWAGLFGYAEGKIENLNITGLLIDIDSTEYGTVYVGGLVAENTGGIENCSVEGKINLSFGKEFFIGGVAGSTGGIAHCSSDVSINAYYDATHENGGSSQWLGGLAGYYTGNKPIETSYSQGIIDFSVSSVVPSKQPKAFSARIGGLIGESSGNLTTVQNCYSEVKISNSQNGTGTITAGGLIGISASAVKNCYTTGDIEICSSSGYAGGLLGSGGLFGTGYNNISHCWTVGDVILQEGEAGSIIPSQNEVVSCYYSNTQVVVGNEIVKNGTPAHIDDFKKIDFYSNRMEWDTDIWCLIEGEFPRLK
ncbi:MAG: hypothetical protein E7643_00125 [Ruminococcaceae bacterium]|nr:hypothetical protein [Oscillospiraceae bacterium]